MAVQSMDLGILTGYPFSEPLSAIVVVEEHVVRFTAGAQTILLS